MLIDDIWTQRNSLIRTIHSTSFKKSNNIISLTINHFDWYTCSVYRFELKFSNCYFSISSNKVDFKPCTLIWLGEEYAQCVTNNQNFIRNCDSNTLNLSEKRCWWAFAAQFVTQFNQSAVDSQGTKTRVFSRTFLRLNALNIYDWFEKSN